MEQCPFEKSVIAYFGLGSDVQEKTEVKTDFGHLVNLLVFHLEEVVKAIPANRIGYFLNEKGNFSITKDDEPIAQTSSKQYAEQLVYSYSALTKKIVLLEELSKNDKRQAINLKDRIDKVEHDWREKVYQLQQLKNQK